MSGKVEDNSTTATTPLSMMTLSYEDAKQSAYSIKQIWLDFKTDPSLIFGKEFTLFGQCYTEREQGKGTLQFVELMDGSTVQTLQCVCNSSDGFADWDQFLKHCTRGATVEFTGTLIESPAKGQPIELQVKSYKRLGAIEDPGAYFMGSRGFISRDTLRQIPHQRHHAKQFLAIQILKQCAYRSLHEAMAKLGIGEIQPTILTGNECEDGAHPFTVTTMMDGSAEDIPRIEGTDQIDWSKDFLHKHLYLTVSSQLHLEATVLGTRRDGYCMTTAFRAEPSSGPLHLAEFLMPEWELVGGQCTLERNMAVAQAVLKYVFSQILKHHIAELEFLEEYRQLDLGETKKQKLVELGGCKKTMKKQEFVEEKRSIEEEYERKIKTPSLIDRLQWYVDKPFVVTTHAECVRLMLQHEAEGKVKFDETPGYGDDFTKQHEFYITEVLYNGTPTFVRYYPKDIKAFYMPIIDSAQVQSAPTDGVGDSAVEYVDCYDLLFPYVGEVVGGSQRIDDAVLLVSRMEELGMDTSSESELDWYVQLRRDASLPHGGAGLGFGRMMIAITGIPNIRDLQEFPRGYGLSCKA